MKTAAFPLEFRPNVQPTPAPSQLESRAAFFATHVTAAAYITLIAKMRLSECI